MIDETLMAEAVLAVRRIIEATEYGEAREVMHVILAEAFKGPPADWGAVFLFNMTPYEAGVSIMEGIYEDFPVEDADQFLGLLEETAKRCGSLLKADTLGEA